MTFAPTNFDDEFRAALRSAGDPTQHVTSEQLFSAWFRSRGHSYFFLFTKNLSVTSLQHAELLSLVRVHVRDATGQAGHLQFLTVDDFFADFRSLLADLQRSFEDRDALADALLELYGNWLRRLIVVELFYGSCTVFTPPHLNLDLYSVCRESGYVHSCGDNIYTRRFEQLDPDDIVATLKTHLGRDPGNAGSRRFVSVYAHEDFTMHDRKYSSELSGGLDESKVFVEKYYVGAKRFVAFIDQLREQIGEAIHIPAPGPYKEQRTIALKDPDVDRTRTIWFIVDREIGRTFRHPGNQRYLICYEQKYKNYNPFHVFDENKPAWVSHTTIPHTLAGAMINITRPWWPAERPVVVADPFSGTGTVWLECHKLKGVRLQCGDVAPIAPLLAQDNREFFALSLAGIEKLMGEVEGLKNAHASLAEPTSRRPVRIEKGLESYQRALVLFDQIAKEEREDIEIPASVVEELRSCSFVERLLFYVCLRTHVRHSGGFDRGSEQWGMAFFKELDVLIWQIEELAGLRRREEETAIRSEGTESEFVGTYSLGASIPPSAFENREDLALVAVRDARQTVREHDELADVIVTDPPYGFNTDERPAELARIYAESIRAMIGSLNDGGQLVMAVPERSYTGRRVASFVTRAWLTQQVIAEARVAGLEAVVSAQVFPRPGGIFFPPYYWESAKALGRSILHFRFRRI